MIYKKNATRARLAKIAVKAAASLADQVAAWYAEAGRDGLTVLPLLALWQVFRRDAEINSASEGYNTLYVTLQRLVNGKPKAKQAAATTAPVRVSKKARTLLNAVTLKLAKLGYTVSFTVKLSK
jgi:hypothetical protein